MNIHNHTVLTKLKIPSKLWDEQVAWVRGYILALEDVIKDLRAYWELTHDEARLYHSINETLTQARATLARMEEMEDETANSPGARSASGAPDPEDQGHVPDPGAV